MLSSALRCAKGLDKPAHGAVHVGHDRRVNRHDVVEAVLFGRRDVVPRSDGRRARRERPRLIDHAQLDLLGVPLLAELVPADLVLAAEFRDFVLRGLQGEMRGVVGEIQEEGLFRRPRLIDELDAVVGPKVGRIPALRQQRIVVGQVPAVEEQSRALASA